MGRAARARDRIGAAVRLLALVVAAVFASASARPPAAPTRSVASIAVARTISGARAGHAALERGAYERTLAERRADAGAGGLGPALVPPAVFTAIAPAPLLRELAVPIARDRASVAAVLRARARDPPSLRA